MSDDQQLLETLALLPADALLEPIWNYSSPRGFYYSVPHAKDQERLAADLERLVAAGFAERVFVDRISLCPNCSSHTLNVREICLSCGSSNLEQFKALFHFRCGYVGPDASFGVEPGGLRCPKCHRLLADLGTDYDSPGTFFRCGACAAQFQTPEIGGRCLSCGGKFDQHGMQNVQERDVFAYRITELGKNALAKRAG